MAPLPATMKAVVIDKPGGPEALRYAEDIPVPKLKDSEVLVKSSYSGVNFIDTYFRSGLYPAPHLPYVIGYEGTGEIVSAGSGGKYGLQEGDTVMWMHPSSYAEFCAVPAEKLIKIPKDINPEKALGSCLMGITALALVKESYEVKKGDTILVHAAAGGVGLLLCQLGREAGATVIGTASTAEKCDTAKANGATHMINYKEKPDWISEVRKIIPDGVDCVYDGVGKTTWDGSLEIVKRKGTVISFGSASGQPAPLDIQRLGKKVTKITRAVVFQYVVTREELDYYAGLLFEHIRNGTLTTNFHDNYHLKDAKQAHMDLEGRLTSGKLLLKIGN